MVVGEIVNGKLYLLSFLIFPMLNTIEDKSMTILFPIKETTTRNPQLLGYIMLC